MSRVCDVTTVVSRIFEARAPHDSREVETAVVRPRFTFSDPALMMICACATQGHPALLEHNVCARKKRRTSATECEAPSARTIFTHASTLSHVQGKHAHCLPTTFSFARTRTPAVTALSLFMSEALLSSTVHFFRLLPYGHCVCACICIASLVQHIDGSNE